MLSRLSLVKSATPKLIFATCWLSFFFNAVEKSNASFNEYGANVVNVAETLSFGLSERSPLMKVIIPLLASSEVA